MFALRTSSALLAGLSLLLACGDEATGPGSSSRPQVKELRAGLSNTCALLDDGTLWCWGPGTGGVAAAVDSGPVQQPLTDSIIAFGLGYSALCAVTAAQATYCWGSWYPVDNGVSYGDLPTLLTDTLPLTSLSSGMGHTCGVLTTGEVTCWGSSILGKRGRGVPDSTLGSTIPNLVAGASGYSAVVAGVNHSCGLVQSGGLVTCWGDGIFLGDSSGALVSSDTACFYQTSCALAPILVTSLHGIEQIAAGSQGTCAIDGTVWCWGFFGTPLPRPTVVALPDAAALITVGNGFACALTSAGQAYCWGRTGPWLGHAGAGTAPAPVNTDLRFRLLAAGNTHACGVGTDARVYCWGAPTFGSLGPGLETATTTPTRIRGPW